MSSSLHCLLRRCIGAACERVFKLAAWCAPVTINSNMDDYKYANRITLFCWTGVPAICQWKTTDFTLQYVSNGLGDLAQEINRKCQCPPGHSLVVDSGDESAAEVLEADSLVAKLASLVRLGAFLVMVI